LKNEIEADLAYLADAFKASKNDTEFVTDNGTDVPVSDNYLFKNNLPTVSADDIFAA
jgi:hypothetical protein